jgi:hypothetical protein
VIGDHERGALARQILDTTDFNPEPRPEKESQQRPNDRAIEVWIEPEFVNRVVTGQPLPEKSGNCGDALGKLIQRRLGCRRRTRDTPVLIDFADDGGDLFGRRAAAWIGQ